MVFVRTGGSQLMPVIVIVGSVVVMPMVVTMIVVVRLAEDQRAGDVDRETDAGDDDGLLVADLLRFDDPRE